MLYHVTEAKNVDSIMRNGLIPMIGERSRQAHETTPYVYLFHSLDDVHDAVMNWLDIEDFVVLSVDIKEYTVNGFEVLVNKTIPTQYISIVDM